MDALVGNKASVATRESFRKRLRDGDLDDNEIEIAVAESNQMPSFEIPGMPGANVGMINIGEMIGKSMGNKEKKKKMSVKESHEILINDESDKLIEQDNTVLATALIYSLSELIASNYPLNEDVDLPTIVQEAALFAVELTDGVRLVTNFNPENDSTTKLH